MICKAVVSSKEGDRFRVLIGSRVSAPFPRIRHLRAEHEAQYQEEITVGDTVAVALLGNSMADGLVLGKIDIT